MAFPKTQLDATSCNGSKRIFDLKPLKVSMGKGFQMDLESVGVFRDYLLENETIVWADKPDFRHYKSYLQTKFFHIFFNFRFSQIRLSVILIVLGVTYIGKPYWALVELLILLAVILLLRPLVLPYFRYKHTKYAFSEKRAFFQLWRMGKTSIHIVNFENIVKAPYQVFEMGVGIIHFMPKVASGFHTYDLIDSERRFYPTFEMIENAIEVQKFVEALINKQR